MVSAMAQTCEFLIVFQPLYAVSVRDDWFGTEIGADLLQRKYLHKQVPFCASSMLRGYNWGQSALSP